MERQRRSVARELAVPQTIADHRYQVSPRDSVFILEAGGQLHCVHAKTGKKTWLKELLSEYRVPDSYFGVGTSPLVVGKRVLVNVGGKNAGIVAFHTANGQEAWKATTDGASYSSPVAATWHAATPASVTL